MKLYIYVYIYINSTNTVYSDQNQKYLSITASFLYEILNCQEAFMTDNLSQRDKQIVCNLIIPRIIR